MIKLFERIVETDWVVTAFNRQILIRGGLDRIVRLECGHSKRTSAIVRARCSRCEEMLRRSIDTGEEDYEGFRSGLVSDRMAWAADPCRLLNEPGGRRWDETDPGKPTSTVEKGPLAVD